MATKLGWLAPSLVEACIPEMERRGVSAVARGEKPGATLYGFLEGYLSWGRVWGTYPARVNETWAERRARFLARHLAQVQKRKEPLWKPDGSPTNRHLALIAWAYSPSPARLRRWLSRAAPPPQPGRRPSTPRR